jgi:hypothetical protein
MTTLSDTLIPSEPPVPRWCVKVTNISLLAKQADMEELFACLGAVKDLKLFPRCVVP